MTCMFIICVHVIITPTVSCSTASTEKRGRGESGRPMARHPFSSPLFSCTVYVLFFYGGDFFYSSAAPSPPIGWEGEKFYSLLRRHLHLAFSSSVWLLVFLFHLRAQKLMMYLDVSPIFLASKSRGFERICDISAQGNNRSNFAVRTSTTNNNNKQRSGNSHRRHLLLFLPFIRTGN